MCTVSMKNMQSMLMRDPKVNSAWPPLLPQHLPGEQGEALPAGLRLQPAQPAVLRPGAGQTAGHGRPAQDQGGRRVQVPKFTID